jgi:hypothetical protein
MAFVWETAQFSPGVAAGQQPPHLGMRDGPGGLAAGDIGTQMPATARPKAPDKTAVAASLVAASATASE